MTAGSPGAGRDAQSGGVCGEHAYRETVCPYLQLSQAVKKNFSWATHQGYAGCVEHPQAANQRSATLAARAASVLANADLITSMVG